MITVEFFEEDGLVTGFKVEGHAGYAESGSDIVCSAVSMLVINTINSISELLGEDMEVVQDSEEGLIECRLTDTPSDGAQLLLDSLRLGLVSTQESYGSEYITLIES